MRAGDRFESSSPASVGHRRIGHRKSGLGPGKTKPGCGRTPRWAAIEEPLRTAFRNVRSRLWSGGLLPPRGSVTSLPGRDLPAPLASGAPCRESLPAAGQGRFAKPPASRRRCWDLLEAAGLCGAHFRTCSSSPRVTPRDWRRMEEGFLECSANGDSGSPVRTKAARAAMPTLVCSYLRPTPCRRQSRHSRASAGHR